MKVGILTSSRADYGIYLPLLKALKEDSFFEMTIIAFGTHLSPFHGNTIDVIINDGFEVDHTVESMLHGDSVNAISTAMALTSMKFAEFWKLHQVDFDIVFCLGDRYEMFAAVVAGIPFNIQFAHLHGGERTLGAIDNIFRHAITLASRIHFVSCADYENRITQLTETEKNIYNVGALSLDNLSSIGILSIEEFQLNFGIDLSIPTILSTIHPETVDFKANEVFGEEYCKAMEQLKDFQILITLPNADTNGLILRKQLLNLAEKSDRRVICVENLGPQGYFSAMKHCALLVGNTSSGIIEAASFNKWVINLGDRQKGRAQSTNTISIPFNSQRIIEAVKDIKQGQWEGKNIYYKEGVAHRIIEILKA